MRQSTVALLILLACTILAAWFFTTHEKVSRKEFTGYTGEARVNDFLAADLLLQELGIESDSRPSLTPSEWLPEFTDTLVVRLSPAFSVESERELLTDWVLDGGHLVLLPPDQESRVVDEFLAFLGFQLFPIETEEDDDSGDESETDDEQESYDYQVDLENTRYRVDVTFEDSLGATLSDDKGIVVARRELGAGYVTVVATSRYFSNRSIDESDHARLLLDTVAGYIQPGNVWFIYDASFAPLWQLIWDNAPYVVISFAVILVFWLWSIMPKFGPAIRPESLARRSIIEHVGAAGHFAWRNNGAGVLAASSAAAVMHDAESRHPGISRLSALSQAKQLARMTGLPAQAITDALTGSGQPRHRDFTHDMQALQRIRKKI